MPVDSVDTVYEGFPLPFVGPGWHTSLSLQIFVLELIFDFLIYFLFWFILIFCINRFLIKIKVNKFVVIGLWTFSIFILFFNACIYSNNVFYLKRPYDMEIIETGYKFIWQNIERPDYQKYKK